MNEKIDVNTIKCVIWDLDETLWDGIVTEGGYVWNEQNIELVKALADRGVICSICSKNNKEEIQKILEEHHVAEYFVFNSINWEPKGNRVRQQILDMGLRAPNILFLDDNSMNRGEVKAVNPEIMVGYKDEINMLMDWVAHTDAKDLQHKRLHQYHVLQQKSQEREQFSSNEAFLMQSNIVVEIGHDCDQELERIVELIKRTNQLNYTKIRSSAEEIKELIDNQNIQCGYIRVSDRFGEYGIIGFYAMDCTDPEQKYLVHFLFSCRTIGMGVEQYVYAKLGYPKLTVNGDVVAFVDQSPAPAWINNESAPQEQQEKLAAQKNKKILFKGPCDLDSIFSYIHENENIESEFTYVSEKTGVAIEQINHTAHTVESLTLTQEQKDKIINEVPFGDAKMYSDKMFTDNYDIVFYSILQDANLGVYKRKESGELVAFGQGYYPMTNPDNWDKYIENKVYTAQCKFTKEILQDFTQKYDCLGILTPQQVMENIYFMREHLDKHTKLVLMLGTETEYAKNTSPAWAGKNLYYKELNALIREYAKDKDNVSYIDINNYIHGQESFFDHYNHFRVSVYYEMSQDIIKMINDHEDVKIKNKSPLWVWLKTQKQKWDMYQYNKACAKRKA